MENISVHRNRGRYTSPGINHPHSELNEEQVMMRTFIAMCLPALAAVLAMGTNALFNILTALATALVFHYLLRWVDFIKRGKPGEPVYETPYSPLVAGMIVGLCMGELSPYYITALVSFMTVAVFKWGQEKVFGRKIVNPAAAAKALVLLVITVLWFLPHPLVSGMLFYPDHLRYSLYTAEGFAAAMDLAEAVGFYGTGTLSVAQSLILWKTHGWIGGASAVVTIAAGILLTLWIKLKWRIPLTYLLTMAVGAAAVGVATGGDILLRVAFHVFTGSVVFLAFFMATEPQTSPVTEKGQYIFGAGLAIITMFLQLVGFFGGSFVALVLLNTAALHLDKTGIKMPFGQKNRVFSPRTAVSAPLPDTSSPVMVYDASKCILCSRCIKACDEIQGKGVLGFGARGLETFVTGGVGRIGASECDGCGECIELCPTGALQEKEPLTPLRRWEAKAVRSTCPYCGIGCQLELWIREGKIAKVRGVEALPSNGSLCIKGRFGLTYVNSNDRLTQPLVKRNGTFEPASWNEALSVIESGLRQVKEKAGPGAIGGLSSGKCTNEENYLFQKFMRAALGTNNIDHGGRLGYASTLAGLGETFGSGATAGSIPELEHSDCIIVAGSNTTESHPVIAGCIIRAVRKHGAKLIVIDPRQIELARYATLWLRPRIGSDGILINGMMNLILREDTYREEFVQKHAENFSKLKTVIDDYPPQKVADICGILPEKLLEAAQMYGKAKAASIVYGSGISQQSNGADNIISLANLAMLTGNVDHPSSGVYPLVGQNNTRGACDMGALPDFLPGYQRVEEPEVRTQFQKYWGKELPGRPGLSGPEMISEAAAGRLQAMIVMGHNPVLSYPNRIQVETALKNLDLLVVVDQFLSDTAELATVVLPAASFAEKDGTFTNIESRVLLINKALTAPGKARPDWKILSALSSRFEYPMPYKNPAQIMEEISEVVPSYKGVRHRQLTLEGIRLSCPDDDRDGPQFQQGNNFPRERRRFQGVKFNGAPLPEEGYPFFLSTGRLLFHSHTGTMSRRAEALNSYADQAFVEIHPEDAAYLELFEGEIVKVRTRWGEIEIGAKISRRVARGSVFLPVHFYDAPANLITGHAPGPRNKAPALKATPCQIEKVVVKVPYLLKMNGGDIYGF